jgi:hypothetical protein
VAAAPGLDRGLFIRPQHIVTRSQRRSVEDSGVQVRYHCRLGGVVRGARRDPRPVLPRLDRVTGQPAGSHRRRGLARWTRTAPSAPVHWGGSPPPACRAHRRSPRYGMDLSGAPGRFRHNMSGPSLRHAVGVRQDRTRAQATTGIDQDQPAATPARPPAQSMAHSGQRKRGVSRRVRLQRGAPNRPQGPAIMPTSIRRLGQHLGFRGLPGQSRQVRRQSPANGLPIGRPEEALDCACGLYLGDPTAWLQPDESTPTTT